MGPGHTSMAMCSWMVMAKLFPFRTVIGLRKRIGATKREKKKNYREFKKKTIASVGLSYFQVSCWRSAYSLNEVSQEKKANFIVTMQIQNTITQNSGSSSSPSSNNALSGHEVWLLFFPLTQSLCCRKQVLIWQQDPLSSWYSGSPRVTVLQGVGSCVFS